MPFWSYKGEKKNLSCLILLFNLILYYIVIIWGFGIAPIIQLMFVHQVKVTPTEKSRFIIRRQPNDHCLSTVESGALALSILEQRPEIMQVMVWFI